MAKGKDVIAVEGLRPPAPWVLFESTSFEGRFYFLNSVTNESKWVLPAELFNDAETPSSPPDPHEHPEAAFKRALIAAQGVGETGSGETVQGASNSDSGGEGFAKRERDILDPRVISTDLEHLLTSAMSKASKIERSMGNAAQLAKSKPAASGTKPKTPKQPKGVVPSSESFQAMRNSVEGEEPALAQIREDEVESTEKNKNSHPATVTSSSSSSSSSSSNHSGSPAKSQNSATAIPRGGGGNTATSKTRINGMSTSMGNELSKGSSESGSGNIGYEYTVLNGLGSGGYSNVLLVRNKRRDGLLAMKAVSKGLLTTNRDQDRLRNELRALTEIPASRFLQRCFAAFETPSHVFFVTEYLKGGDLFFHLTRRVDATAVSSINAGFSEKEAKILLSEVVLGLVHMHKHNFIHCDIKVENIMLDARGHVKLIDFGLAAEISKPEEPVSPIGSLIYMAPELLTKGTGGRHTDWWALGVLAHEMITGRSPWSSLTDKKLIKRQIRTLCIVPPRGISAKAGQFICALLTQDFRERLGTRSSNDVKQDPFFSGIDWIATAAGTAPPGLVPPPFAFIEEDCERALQGYQSMEHEQPEGSSGNWSLGVEATPTAPPVKVEPFEVVDSSPAEPTSIIPPPAISTETTQPPPPPSSSSSSSSTSSSTARGRTPRGPRSKTPPKMRSKTPKAQPPKRTPRNGGKVTSPRNGGSHPTWK